jgi:hypothetical protein
MNPAEFSPHVELMKIITSKWISKPVYAAAELGIADHLAGGPMHIDDLAEGCGADASILYRMMRALASVGIFTEIEERIFDLTPIAELLRPGALGAAARMFGSRWNDEAWMRFADGVRTGNIPFEIAHGKDISTWLRESPAEAKMLMEANAMKIAAAAPGIVEAYDFSAAETIVDVGGGGGLLLVAILESCPRARGIIAETPAVAAEARNTVTERGMDVRCNVVECDFFESVPEGGDLYILSNILHDWDDEHCRMILRCCRDAVGDAGRLLVVESIVPPGNEWSIAKLLDLEMFVINGGMERTEREYADLLGESRFEISRIVPTSAGVSMIEAACV